MNLPEILTKLLRKQLAAYRGKHVIIFGPLTEGENKIVLESLSEKISSKVLFNVDKAIKISPDCSNFLYWSVSDDEKRATLTLSSVRLNDDTFILEPKLAERIRKKEKRIEAIKRKHRKGFLSR